MGDSDRSTHVQREVDELDELQELFEQEEDNSSPLLCCLRYKSLLTGLFLLLFTAVGIVFMKRWEGWTTLTAIYVIMQIITTVGYGDLTVTTQEAMIFMSFYVLFCIVFVASIVNDVAGSLMDREDSKLRSRMKECVQEIDEGRPATGQKNSFSRYHLDSLLVSVVVFLVFVLAGTLFYDNYESCSCSYGHTKEANYPNCTDTGPEEQQNCLQGQGETKDFIKAFYMSVITLTTVGFGDFTPLSRLGRGVGIFWMLFGVFASGNMVSCISHTLHAITKEKKTQKKNSWDLFNQFDTKGTGSLNREQFLQYMLLKQDLVKQSQVDDIQSVYNAMQNRDGLPGVSFADIEYHFAHDED
jgi:potassium channel subfamily K